LLVWAALQNADLVVRTEAGRRQKKRSHPTNTAGPSTPSKHASASHSSGSGGTAATTSPSVRYLPSDQEEQAAQARALRLFEASKLLDDDAFRWFVVALCRLNAEMIGIPTSELGQLSAPEADVDHRTDLDYSEESTSTPKQPKRTGINVIRTLVSHTMPVT
jgi:hypothetical protein